MERWEAKLISLFGMFIVIFISMILPIKVSDIIHKQGEHASRILALLRCFAGGVFLGTILLHMIPEVHDQIQEALLEPQDIDYPISELIIAGGFFFICIFERIALHIHQQNKKSKMNGVTLTRQVMHNAHISQPGDTPCALNEVMDASSHINQAYELSGSSNSIPEANGVATPKGQVPEGFTDDSDGSTDFAQARSIILVLALSFECIFDGLSVGLQLTETGTWNMFIAIISHEFIIAFCLGIELVKYHSKKKVAMAAFAYAIIPPVGCTVGIVITETDMEVDEDTLEVASGFLIAISAGIFLYCTFIGMLGEELIEHSTFEKILLTILGCAVMAALAALPEDDEEEELPEDGITTPMYVINSVISI